MCTEQKIQEEIGQMQHDAKAMMFERYPQVAEVYRQQGRAALTWANIASTSKHDAYSMQKGPPSVS